MPRRNTTRSGVKALSSDEVNLLEAEASRHSERKELTVLGLLHSGLRADELAHCRPEWFGRHERTPYISVPGHEPCQCRMCMYKATTNAVRWAEAENPDEERPEVGTGAFRREVRGRQERMWLPKSPSGERKANMSDWDTWHRLRELVEEHGVFPGSRTAIYKRVKAVEKSVETEVDVTAHTLRHTYCMQAIRGGMTIEMLKENAGHASIESTQRYVKPEDDQVSEASADAFGLQD